MWTQKLYYPRLNQDTIAFSDTYPQFGNARGNSTIASSSNNDGIQIAFWRKYFPWFCCQLQQDSFEIIKQLQ